MGKKFLGIGFYQRGGEKWVGRGWEILEYWFAKGAEKKSTGPRNRGVGKKFLGIGFCQRGGAKIDRSSEPGGGEKILGYWFLPKGRRKMGRSGWGKNAWVLVFAKGWEKNGSVGGVNYWVLLFY